MTDHNVPIRHGNIDPGELAWFRVVAQRSRDDLDRLPESSRPRRRHAGPAKATG